MTKCTLTDNEKLMHKAEIALHCVICIHAVHTTYPGAFSSPGDSGGWLGCLDSVVKVGGVFVSEEVISKSIQLCWEGRGRVREGDMCVPVRVCGVIGDKCGVTVRGCTCSGMGLQEDVASVRTYVTCTIAKHAVSTNFKKL